VAANSFEFKSLADAMRIRNHAIDMFERAEHAPDLVRRQAMLSAAAWLSASRQPPPALNTLSQVSRRVQLT